jgi:hypothetical protein
MASNRLNVLVGEWDMKSTIGEELMAHSRTTFQWLNGSAFLAQHVDAPDFI